jgi:hypothetical protein
MPLNSPGVAAADLELLAVALDADDLPAAEVARDAGDGLHVDQRAAVDLPEQLGSSSSTSSLIGLRISASTLARLHAGVLLVADEEQHLVDRDHLDRLAHAGLDPLQVLRRAAGFSAPPAGAAAAAAAAGGAAGVSPRLRALRQPARMRSAVSCSARARPA